MLAIDWCGKGHVQTLHGMTSCRCLKQLSLTTELNMIMKVIILPTLIYICYNHSSEFRVDLHYSQNLASLLLKICYFTFLGQGWATDAKQTIL